LQNKINTIPSKVYNITCSFSHNNYHKEQEEWLLSKRRLGLSESWNFSKIIKAVEKSAKRVEKEIDQEFINQLEKNIADRLDGKKEIHVTRLHDIVELALHDIDIDVAASYMNYRNYKKEFVMAWEEIYQKSKNVLYLGDRENANFNSALISTKGSLVRGYLTKEMYRKFYLSREELTAIDKGFIYIHDIRDLIFGSFNCCLFDIATILKGGFEMSGIKYKEPKTVLSALQVIGDITLVATAQQFGGFTISEIDKVLVPYVRKSIAKYEAEAVQFGIADVDAYVTKKIDEEIMQGLQSFEMKVNTVPSSRGDTAFVTITFGNCDNEEDARIQQAICRGILKTRMNGQGNGSPVVFPKLVYLHSEAQTANSEDQTKLFDLAIECSSKAMYPDYLSLDHGYVGDTYHRTGKVISPMGCRAYLSDYQNEDGESYFVGRANIGAVSLNLPMIWKKSDGKHFYEDLSHYLEMIRVFLKKRYDILANNVCSTNPLAFTQGGVVGGFKNPEDKIGHDNVKSFTASFGVTSLNELNVLAEGKELHESDRNFVNAVVDFIDEKVQQFKEEDGYLYALYATPAESLAGTQLQQFRKEFGIIDGVSDKDYFSNGFHCPVTADITPFEKQDNEYELFHKINGGHIQYVRVENSQNLKAIKTLVKRGLSMGFYQGVNFVLATCEDCGYHPTKVDENDVKCPVCNSDNITIIDRVCGYLGIRYSNGDTRFNDSKLAEVKERISM
jgi:ribonucleoside-triphosphate reductase